MSLREAAGWPGANDDRPRSTVAVVLPGGGARGAYEIGALAALLPALEARNERVSVWCGTSVGAINAAMLASLAHLPVKSQIDAARSHWTGMRKRDVISPVAGRGGLRTLSRAIGHALGVPGVGLASLLDPSPLQASLDRWIDWPMLRRNVNRQYAEEVDVRTGRHLGNFPRPSPTSL